MLRQIVSIAFVLFALPWLGHILVSRYDQTYLPLFFLIQYSVFQGFLAWFFGRTLVSGRTPLVTKFALIFHGGTLPDGIASYGRTVTGVWAVVFFAMVAISAILYCFESTATWSFFANVLYFPILLCLFLGEYLIRRLRFPHLQHAPFLKSIQLYWEDQKQQNKQGTSGNSTLPITSKQEI